MLALVRVTVVVGLALPRLTCGISESDPASRHFRKNGNATVPLIGAAKANDLALLAILASKKLPLPIMVVEYEQDRMTVEHLR
jgi:hypothetical protein